MGILGTIMERRFSAGAGTHLSQSIGWFNRLFGGGPTKAGIDIDEWNCHNLSVVWICVTSISADIAKLPFHVYRRLEGGGKERATDHVAWWLLNHEPNPEMAAFTFRETMEWWALNWGNGYAEIERRVNGKPVYLWPLEPWRVTPKRLKDRSIVYEYQPEDGPRKSIPAADIFHLHGLGDGLCGVNVIKYARESMGAARAAEIFGAKFFGNGARSGGVLQHPGTLGTKAQKNITDSWDAKHAGAENAHKTAVLEEGMKWIANTIPPDEAQFLETRQFSIPEICRWYRFPPHKAMDLLRATFSNIEQQDLQYAGDTCFPWFKRWEQEADRKLLMPSERRTYLHEHLVEGLLRTDIEARYNAYATAKQNGWLNADEIRDRENMNAIPNGEGKQYTVQVNLTTPKKLEAAPAPDAPAPDPAPAPKKDKKKERTARSIIAAARPLLEEAYGRLLRVESDKVRRAAKAPGFLAWTDEFYSKHGDFIRAGLFPIIEAVSESVRAALDGEVPASHTGSVRACVDALAQKHIDRSHADAKGSVETLEKRLAVWDTDRAESQAVQDLEVLAVRLIATWVKE